jgi:hypothetical protein
MRIKFYLACILSYALKESQGFIVGYSASLSHDKLSSQLAATQPVVKSTDTKDDIFISKGFDKQKVDSILPSEAQKQHKASLDAVNGANDSKDLAAGSPSMKIKSSQEPRPFPFSLIIDQQEIKHALLLSAVSPNTIGVLISGGRGTAKSVLARSMERIVPQYIRRIKGSEYNIDPEGKYGVDSFLLQQLKENNTESLNALPTEMVPAPFVQIPLGCMEDSLIGTVDLEQSLETGVAKFSPGLLAKSHRG